MPPSAIIGTPVPFGFGNVLDGGDLGHADTRDDAGGANRAGADADLDRVGAEIDEARAASAVAMLPPMTSTWGSSSDPADPVEDARSGRGRYRRRRRRPRLDQQFDPLLRTRP